MIFLKKLLLVCIVLITGFGVSVFAAPTLANTIEKIIGLEGLSDKIRGIKSSVDTIATDIPSVNEVKDAYGRVYSGAIDTKNTVETGVKDTKNFIDDARKTLSGAQQIYNDAKGVYEETLGVIDGVQDKIDSAKDILGDGQKLQDTLSDNLNKEILE